MYTQQEIDISFQALVRTITTNKKKGGTSCDDVLQYLYENTDRVWLMSWEIINQSTKSGKFLSHRAPARLSDLAIHSSQLVEDRKIGKYCAYRLRTENLHLIETRLGTKENLKKATVPQNRIIIEMRDGMPVAVVV